MGGSRRVRMYDSPRQAVLRTLRHCLQYKKQSQGNKAVRDRLRKRSIMGLLLYQVVVGYGSNARSLRQTAVCDNFVEIIAASMF